MVERRNARINYVVTAEFRARPECVAAFGAFMDRHAALSREEPGCLAFDVCQAPNDGAVFVLYEVYLDEAAYQAHRATPHYGRFQKTAPDLLERAEDSLFVSRRVFARRAKLVEEEVTGG
ncbi:MAG: putative quinol monooxygenase [bacterium]